MRVSVISWEYDGGQWEVLAVCSCNAKVGQYFEQFFEDNLDDWLTTLGDEDEAWFEAFQEADTWQAKVSLWNDAMMELDDVSDMMLIRVEEFEVQ